MNRLIAEQTAKLLIVRGNTTWVNIDKHIHTDREKANTQHSHSTGDQWIGRWVGIAESCVQTESHILQYC
jgi:hypothetical protein